MEKIPSADVWNKWREFIFMNSFECESWVRTVTDYNLFPFCADWQLKVELLSIPSGLPFQEFSNKNCVQKTVTGNSGSAKFEVRPLYSRHAQIYLIQNCYFTIPQNPIFLLFYRACSTFVPLAMVTRDSVHDLTENSLINECGLYIF